MCSYTAINWQMGGVVVVNRLIHLVNPKANSFTTRPIYFGKALYSPLAGLLAVAGMIPDDEYEVVLTDENIEPVDFEMDCGLVGISAMTSYVNRAYEIADEYRRRGVPVLMGGIHPSFIPQEALEHADAVVVGEAELVMDDVLRDFKRGQMQGIYKAKRLHSMAGLPLPRYELIKRNRYLNSAFVNTCRGCHHGCTFCAEHLMFGLPYRYRPLNEVLREIDECGQRTIAMNAADFFGEPEQAAGLMQALRGRGIKWQAGVNSRDASDERLLELAASSGCQMLSIGFESISREALRYAHKYQNRPEDFAKLVKKIQSYGILVFGLFMFGFNQDDESVFDRTVEFNIDAGFDVCAYSVVTPYPGTVDWYRMLRDGRILNFNWDNYDQGHIVYQPVGMTRGQLRAGHVRAYQRFYSAGSLIKRFPWHGGRSMAQWGIYNAFFRRSEVNGKGLNDSITQRTEEAKYVPRPPILPRRRDWRMLIEETADSRKEIKSLMKSVPEDDFIATD